MNSRKEVTANIFLILVGVGYIIYNTHYPLGALANPGPGIFPLALGLLMVILAACQLFQASGKLKSISHGEEQEPIIKATNGERRPLLMILTLIIYLMVVSRIGFLTSTFILVLVCSRLMGAREWVRPIALALGIVLFCYFIFDVWLKLSLPRGYLI